QSEGWSVWWDRQLRGGDYYDDVIQRQLNEVRCVIVMWSASSVQSQYVKAEAAYAQNQNKLIPVRIDNATLPIRFQLVHTRSLDGWDGSKDFSEVRRLAEDIAAILDPAASDNQKRQPAEIQRSIREPTPQKTESSHQPGTSFRDRFKNLTQ